MIIRLAFVLIALLLVVALIALTPRDEPVVVHAKTPSTTVLTDQGVPSLPDSFGELVSALKPKPRPRARTAPTYRPQAVGAIAGTIAGYPCGGGVYPPCYAIARESGGDFHAVNPTGCGGRSCGGRAQWDPVTWSPSCSVARWNGTDKPHQPCETYQGYRFAQEAPPEVQMQREREVYAGGRGCHHWRACG